VFSEHTQNGSLLTAVLSVFCVVTAEDALGSGVRVSRALSANGW
jgi:hypothetical protein